jgi:hypothetical protein
MLEAGASFLVATDEPQALRSLSFAAGARMNRRFSSGRDIFLIFQDVLYSFCLSGPDLGKAFTIANHYGPAAKRKVYRLPARFSASH